MKNLPPLEIAVLAAVFRLQGNAYGVSIMDEVSKREGREIPYGVTHVMLKRLLDKGLLTAKMGEPTSEKGGRRKRFYRPTGEGEAALQAAFSLSQQRFRGLQSLKPVAS